MGSGGHELGDRMSERGVRVDVEDWEGVAAIFNSPFVKDDRDEIHT